MPVICKGVPSRDEERAVVRAVHGVKRCRDRPSCNSGNRARKAWFRRCALRQSKQEHQRRNRLGAELKLRTRPRSRQLVSSSKHCSANQSDRRSSRRPATAARSTRPIPTHPDRHPVSRDELRENQQNRRAVVTFQLKEKSRRLASLSNIRPPCQLPKKHGRGQREAARHSQRNLLGNRHPDRSPVRNQRAY